MNAQTPILTPLAVQNTGVLRALGASEHSTIAGLARQIDRDPDNLRKSLKALEAAGLLQPGATGGPVPELSDVGRKALQAIERAEGPSAPASGGGSSLMHRQIVPDPANPRKHFDGEGILELASSIARDELLENLVVRPTAGRTADDLPMFMLIAGERRWRAIGAAIFFDALSIDAPIPVSIKEVEELTARRLALVENLQRHDLKPMEEARALAALVELDGRRTADVAIDIGYTQRWAQQRLQLLQLSEKLQERLESGLLKIEQARIALAIWPKLPADKREGLEKGTISVETAKVWADAQPTPLSARAKLALAEYIDALKTRPINKGYGDPVVEVQATTERVEKDGYTRVTNKVDDPAFKELEKAHIFNSPEGLREEGVETGRHTVSLWYYASDRIKKELPAVNDSRRRPGLISDLRIEVLGAHGAAEIREGQYASVWLNGPFENRPGIADEIAANRAAREEREAQRKRDQDAANERQAAEARAAQARLQAAIAGEADLLAKPRIDFADGVLSFGTELGIGLPLTMAPNGDLVDCNGHKILEVPYWSVSTDDLARRRALVTIINAAAGLATPTAPATAAPEVLPRAEFVRAVANYLLEDCEDLPEDEDEAEAITTLWAERGLIAFIQSQKIEYGAAEYDWADEGAIQIAELIRVDDLGKQIDVEEAIAAADDAEVPEALRKLAGPGAQPEASS